MKSYLQYRNMIFSLILATLLFALYSCFRIPFGGLRFNQFLHANNESLAVTIKIEMDGSALIKKNFTISKRGSDSFFLVLSGDLLDSDRYKNVSVMDEMGFEYQLRQSVADGLVPDTAIIQRAGDGSTLIQIEDDMIEQHIISVSYHDLEFLTSRDNIQEGIVTIFENGDDDFIKHFSLDITWAQSIIPEFYGMGLNAKVEKSDSQIYLASGYALGPGNGCVIAIGFPLDSLGSEGVNIEEMEERYADNPEILAQLKALESYSDNTTRDGADFFHNKVKDKFRGFTPGKKGDGSMLEYTSYAKLPVIPLVSTIIMMILFLGFPTFLEKRTASLDKNHAQEKPVISETIK